MTQKEISCKWFIRTALAYLGVPYLWAGDDPSGFDGSGFVVECMKSAGFLNENEDLSADGLYNMYKNNTVSYFKEGNLIFYLNSNCQAYHISICLDKYFQIGAFEGDSSNTNLQKAWTKNAFVKIRPIDQNHTRLKIVDLFK